MTSEPTAADLVIGVDGRARCFWATAAPEYIAYHDDEWGRPLRGEQALYERMCLEGFQSGLSWITILRKRDNFRAAFAGFEVDRVAAFGPEDVERLMTDAGIVRHRGKVEAAIGNARAVQQLDRPLDELLWSFVPKHHERPASRAEVAAVTPESTALSKELKRRGFRFVGPTTCYAGMQATGIVDDHIAGCLRAV